MIPQPPFVAHKSLREVIELVFEKYEFESLSTPLEVNRLVSI